MNHTSGRREDDRENMDEAAFCNGFVKSYYESLSTNNVDSLRNLFWEESRMAFQGAKFQGKENIVAILSFDPYARCERRIKTVDFHPSDAAGGLHVFITGVLEFVQQDGTEHGLKFSQTLQVMPTPEGGFYILNDMFRVAAPKQSQVLLDVATVVQFGRGDTPASFSTSRDGTL